VTIGWSGRPICSGAVGGGVQVHEEAADDREDDGRELGPVNAAQVFVERPEPVGRRHTAGAPTPTVIGDERVAVARERVTL
jgi:hypothetical protein